MVETVKSKEKERRECWQLVFVCECKSECVQSDSSLGSTETGTIPVLVFLPLLLLSLLLLSRYECMYTCELLDVVGGRAPLVEPVLVL